MRIVLAPDKFKYCLSAPQVVAAMRDGIHSVDPRIEIDPCPMADGGEGTVEALVSATGGRFETRRVTGPLADMKVDARFGILGDGKTAIIEMAAASGIELLEPQDRDPMQTTTFGTGQLMMAAVELGVTRIILGIGGSATVDGGIGCAQACGLPVILDDGQPVSPGEPLTGQDVARVMYIKHGRGSPIERVQITVAADVTNPLCGPTGAARIFGPQKGATPDQITELDNALAQLARRNDKISIAQLPGSGAAGGLGFGLVAFFSATIQPGVRIVIDAVGLQRRLQSASLCFTGEGRLDSQSLSGKTVHGVAQLCAELKIPCIAIAGDLDPDLDFRSCGLLSAISLHDPRITLAQSMAQAPRLISVAAGNALNSFTSGELSPG